MHNKKVLFIAPRFHTNQFFLTKQLLEKKIEVNFLSVYIGSSENHNYLKPLLSKPSVATKWFLKNKNTRNADNREALRKYHITSLTQCFKIYKKLSPDIVIIRNLRFFISIQHFIIGIILRKKIYLYTQNMYHQKIGYKRKLFFHMLKTLGIKHFTPVLGDVSEPIIPNTLYIPFVMEKMVDRKTVSKKNQNTGIQIITIGKMQERKNLRELVDSLSRINFFNAKNNTLIIVSECIGQEHIKYMESIKKSILMYESQIVFHLNIDHEKVFDLLKESDLFVLPSHDEPAAFSILEAMACGLAVVSSDKNGTKCYIENGINGCVFKYSENFKDLDIVLRKILDKNRLISYGLASLKRIEQHHGINNFYNNLIKN